MSEDVEVLEAEGPVTIVTAQPPAPAEIGNDAMAELLRQFQDAGQAEPYELAKAVQQQANAIAQNMITKLNNERLQNWEITQLAAKLTGGGTYGIPLSVIELTSFLQSLDAEQFEVAKRLFTTISENGLVEFEEYGHGRRMRRKPLPEVYRAPLEAVLAAGHTIADFCQVNDLDASQYDFSQYKEAK